MISGKNKPDGLAFFFFFFSRRTGKGMCGVAAIREAFIARDGDFERGGEEWLDVGFGTRMRSGRHSLTVNVKRRPDECVR